MDLREILAKNPEAKAQYDAEITGLKADFEAKSAAQSAEMDAKIKAENEASCKRTEKILQVCGFSLSETAKKALAGGLSIEEFAVAEIGSLRASLSASNINAMPEVNAQQPDKQMPGKGGKKNDDEDDEPATEENLKKRFGKKEK
jgi:hypothetical protein